MNKNIENQLKKVAVADISGYTPGCSEFIIPKTKKSVFEVNKTYLIELDDSLLEHNKDSIVETNYNAGKIPTNKYYSIEVSGVFGKLIKCVGMAFDIITRKNIPSFWSGYLPVDCIKIIDEGE